MVDPKTLSYEEVEALIEQLQSKYSRIPTPPSLAEFEQQNPEFAENKKSVTAYCKEMHDATPLNYLRQLGLVSKASRQDTVPPEAMPSRGATPRPEDDVVMQFEHKVAPREGLLENCGQDIVFDSFECNLNTEQQAELIKAFGMLKVGDYVELEPYGPWGVKASFCDVTLGYIERTESAKHSLTSRIRHANSWGLLDGKVYAQIIGFRAVKRPNVKKKSPQAALFVTCAMDPSRQNVADGLLLSEDSRSLIGFAGDARQDVVVPEGVEEIVDWAFYEQDVSTVKLPESLRAIGEEAFARTSLGQVSIPAGVEDIGLRAFVRGMNKNEPGVVNPQRWEDNGPVRFEVADTNKRFSSKDGSLIETIGKDRVLRSAYYDCPRSNSKNVRLPEGATVLGEACLVSYSPIAIGCEGFCWLAVEVPDGVKRIEDDWSCTYSIEKITLPSTSVKMSKKLKKDLDSAINTRSR